MITPSNSLQRLVTLSTQLEEVIQKRSLSAVFAKSVQSDTATQSRRKRLFVQVKQLLNQILSPQRHILKTNLLECQKYFDAIRNIEPVEFGNLQKTYTADLEETVNTFADRLDKIRNEAVSVLEEEKRKENKPDRQRKIKEQINVLSTICFQKIEIEEKCATDLDKALQSQTSLLADELVSVVSQEERNARITQAFQAARQAVVPDGIRIKNPEVLQGSFIQKVETRRSELVKKEIDDFVRILETKLTALRNQIDTIELRSVVKEFSDFANANRPRGISTQEFTDHGKIRIIALAKQALEVAKKTIAFKLGDQKTRRANDNEIFERFSFLRREILDSPDLSDSEKKLILKEFARCEDQLISQKLAERKTYTVDSPAAPVVVGDHTVQNITRNYYNTAAERVQKVAFPVMRNLLIKTAAYIVFEALSKGPSSVLSSSFLLSLTAPYIANFACEKLCEDLPSSVSTYVKPFIMTFSARAIARCVVPYVDHAFHQLLPTGGVPEQVPEQAIEPLLANETTILTNETTVVNITNATEVPTELHVINITDETAVVNITNATEAPAELHVINITEEVPVQDLVIEAQSDSVAAFPSTWQKIVGAWDTFVKAREALQSNTPIPSGPLYETQTATPNPAQVLIQKMNSPDKRRV